MVYNCMIKCQVCGAVTRVRLQVGFQQKHPIVVVCGRCGTSLNGRVAISQTHTGLSFKFENADVIPGIDKSDYVVECSGEFTVRKFRRDGEGKVDLSPFMRNMSRMGSKRYDEYCQTISKLNNFSEQWAKYKRIIDLFDKNDRTYLLNEIWKILPKEHFPCRNEFEIARAVHMIEVIYFLEPLRPEIITDLELSTSVTKLDIQQMNLFIDFLNSHEGYSLKELRSSVYKIYDEFVSAYQYLVPAISLQYCDKSTIDFEREGTTTSSFNSVKQFSLDAYETLGNLLIIPIGLNNILLRNDYSKCSEKDCQSITLDDFIKKTKAVRFHYCDKGEKFTGALDVIINQKLRNAIGHNDVSYDCLTQEITYVPDPKNRLKKEKTYLLEFENEAVHLFQAITVISEYLYRVCEIEMIKNGYVPLPLDQGLAQFKKVGRNAPCPCGSGLKYKRCHGKG